MMMPSMESSTKDILMLIMGFLTNGFTVYFLRDIMLGIKAQMVYERTFLDYYQEVMEGPPQDITEAFPLAFEEEETSNLLRLCRIYKSKWSPSYYLNLWTLMSFEPKIETQYIRIRRLGLVPKAIKTDLIRCNEKFALIAAGDGFTGYILKIDKANQDKNKTIFNIDGKFLYKEKPSHVTPPVDRSVSQHELLRARSTNNWGNIELQAR